MIKIAKDQNATRAVNAIGSFHSIVNTVKRMGVLGNNPAANSCSMLSSAIPSGMVAVANFTQKIAFEKQLKTKI